MEDSDDGNPVPTKKCRYENLIRPSKLGQIVEMTYQEEQKFSCTGGEPKFTSTTGTPRFTFSKPEILGNNGEIGVIDVNHNEFVPFSPSEGKDVMIVPGQENGWNCQTWMQSITAMKEYDDKSFEELRFEDYMAKHKTVGPEMSTLINVNHELREKLEASSLFIKMHEAMGRDYRENYEKSIEELKQRSPRDNNNKTFKTALGRANAESARLRSDLEAKTGEVNDLKRKYDDLLSQNNPQQIQKQQNQEQISKLKDEKAELTNRLEGSLKELDEKVNDLQDKCDKLETRNHNMKTTNQHQIRSLNRRLSESEKARSDIAKKLAASQNALAASEKKLKASENARRVSRNMLAASQNARAVEKKLFVVNENARAASEKKLMASENTRVASEKELKASEIAQAISKKKLMANGNMQVASEKELQAIENALAASEKKFMVSENDLAASEKKLQASENERAAIEKKLLESENARAVGQKKLAASQNALTACEKKLAIDQNLRVKIERLAACESKLAQSECARTLSESKLAESDKARLAAESEVRDLKSQIQSLESSKAGNDVIVAELTRDMNRLVANLQILQNKVECMEKEKQVLENAGGHIEIKIVGENGVPVHFRIKKSTQMGKLKRVYCNKVKNKFLRFMFEGGEVGDGDTPTRLEMEDADIIEAHPAPVIYHEDRV